MRSQLTTVCAVVLLALARWTLATPTVHSLDDTGAPFWSASLRGTLPANRINDANSTVHYDAGSPDGTNLSGMASENSVTHRDTLGLTSGDILVVALGIAPVVGAGTAIGFRRRKRPRGLAVKYARWSTGHCRHCGQKLSKKQSPSEQLSKLNRRAAHVTTLLGREPRIQNCETCGKIVLEGEPGYVERYLLVDFLEPRPTAEAL